MRKSLGIFLLTVSILAAGCVNRDDIVLATCEDGDSFVLDFFPLSFFDNVLWLSEADGDLAFENSYNSAASAVSFVNFPNACEEKYTASVMHSIYDPGFGFSNGFEVRHFIGVSNATPIDLRLPGGAFGGNVIANLFIPNTQISIVNAPDVAEVLISRETPSGGYEALDFYQEFDQVIVEIGTPTSVPQLETYLRVKTADGQWYGLLLTMGIVNNPAGILLDFSNAAPMQKYTASFDFPDGATRKEWTVSSIGSTTARTLRFIDQSNDETVEVYIPVQDFTSGVLLHTSWEQDDDFHVVQRVVYEWPTEWLALTTPEVISASVTDKAITVDLEDANIFVWRGQAGDDQLEYIRSVIGEIGTSAQTHTLSDLPPITDNRFGVANRNLYDGALQESVQLTAFRFELYSNFQEYLKDIYPLNSTGDAWVKRLSYKSIRTEVQ